MSLKLANTRQARVQHIRVRRANFLVFFLFRRVSFREKKKHIRERTRTRVSDPRRCAPRQIGTMGLDAARAKQIAANKRLMYGAANWRGPIHKNKINFTLGW